MTGIIVELSTDIELLRLKGPDLSSVAPQDQPMDGSLRRKRLTRASFMLAKSNDRFSPGLAGLLIDAKRTAGQRHRLRATHS